MRERSMANFEKLPRPYVEGKQSLGEAAASLIEAVRKQEPQ